MSDNLSISDMRLIIDAGFDSNRRKDLEVSNPELCIYLLDSKKFEEILQTIIKYDNEETN